MHHTGLLAPRKLRQRLDASGTWTIASQRMWQLSGEGAAVGGMQCERWLGGGGLRQALESRAASKPTIEWTSIDALDNAEDVGEVDGTEVARVTDATHVTRMQLV